MGDIRKHLLLLLLQHLLLPLALLQLSLHEIEGLCHLLKIRCPKVIIDLPPFAFCEIIHGLAEKIQGLFHTGGQYKSNSKNRQHNKDNEDDHRTTLDSLHRPDVGKIRILVMHHQIPHLVIMILKPVLLGQHAVFLPAQVREFL